MSTIVRNTQDGNAGRRGSSARVVVGVDGSSDSVAALRAGAWAASLRGASLTAATVWAAPLLHGQAQSGVPDPRAAEAQRRSLAEAFQGNALVPVETVLLQGAPATVLVNESAGADLLVVGSRGHGGFAGLLLGSVSMACTLHAHCPVLVMHSGDTLTDEQESSTGARVVVGVGGGPSSVEVLRAAAQAAEEMDAELLALSAWRDRGRTLDSTFDSEDELQAGAERNLEQQLTDAFPDGRPRHLRSELREGPPAAVLVEASQTADLLVVGRLGRSRSAAVLLGSVSVPVAEHAACPVLVVPGGPAESAGASRSRVADSGD